VNTKNTTTTEDMIDYDTESLSKAISAYEANNLIGYKTCKDRSAEKGDVGRCD
jgi:hypothetical protein